jgi:hypothetical protein
VKVQHTAQFKAKWDDTLFPALAVEGHEKVVKVQVTDTHAERFANSAAGVQKEQNEQMGAALVSPLRLRSDEPFYLCL